MLCCPHMFTYTHIVFGGLGRFGTTDTKGYLLTRECGYIWKWPFWAWTWGQNLGEERQSVLGTKEHLGIKERLDKGRGGCWVKQRARWESHSHPRSSRRAGKSGTADSRETLCLNAPGNASHHPFNPIHVFITCLSSISQQIAKYFFHARCYTRS